MQKLILSLLLLPSTFALPNPTPSSLLISESIFDTTHNGGRFIREAGKGDNTTSTEKCSELKLEDLYSRYENCMNAAQAIIDEVRVDQSVITFPGNQSINER